MELGWIDFSKTERNKVLSVLDMLSEPGTLDELGIAPIRDGFSNLFFPGTSTIQTRAKYFFAVPYALKQLERSKEKNPNKILEKLDTIEKNCGKKLLEQNPNEQGIIGGRSLQKGKWVKRTPADIYWSGLKRYGIFIGEEDLSLSEYVRASCKIKAEKGTLKNLGNRNDNAEENEKDDKNAGELFKMPFWNLSLPYRDNWKEDFSMKLTNKEAQFLSNQIIETCGNSMLGVVLKNEEFSAEFLDCTSFKDIEKIIDKFSDKFPDEIKNDYKMAVEFSSFIYAVRTVYNVIVSDDKNEFARQEFERQKREYGKIANIEKINIDAIMKRLMILNNSFLSTFLKNVQGLMLCGDIEALKKCIISREIQLKGKNRAKSAHPGEFNPDDWFGGKELDYRFNNAKAILRDIMDKEV